MCWWWLQPHIAFPHRRNAIRTHYASFNDTIWVAHCNLDALLSARSSGARDTKCSFWCENALHYIQHIYEYVVMLGTRDVRRPHHTTHNGRRTGRAKWYRWSISAGHHHQWSHSIAHERKGYIVERVCVCDDAVEWHILHYYFDQRVNMTGRQDLFIVNTHLSLQYFGTQFEVLERVASRASNVVRPDKKRHLCAPWAVSG